MHKAVTLSVSDFPVETWNPDYEFIGKGISRLVAMELRKAQDVTIIEREQLQKILEEQELSLSDITDTEEQIRIGKLMAADYLVLGEISDMAETVLITLRLVETTSGEIVWQDKLMEKLTTYDYIGSFFAQAILEHFGTEAEESTLQKIAVKQEKEEDVVIKLSKGIDAYDRKDMATAKKELNKARRIDPENEAARYFLNKLVTNTAKFKVLTEPYYSYQNPAYLGGLKTDKLFFGISGSADSLWYGVTHGNFESENYKEVSDDIYLIEDDWRLPIGYHFPLGDSGWGMGVELFFSEFNNHFSDNLDSNDSGSTGRQFWGGNVGLGKAFGSLSIGAAVG